MTGPKRAAVFWALSLGAGAVLVLLTLALGIAVWASRDGVTAVHAGLIAAAPWLLVWRLSLFTLLMLYWRELADRLCQTLSLGADSRVAIGHWRWRAGIGLILMDLVLVEDAIGRLQRAFA